MLLIFVFSAAAMVNAKMTLDDEIKIGRDAAKEIEKEFPVTENKEWLAEIDRMGKSLTPYVSRKDIPYIFKIIKEEVRGVPQVDAFSLPGGPVYFSERMWRILTPDERLGVLGHEIAHIDKRHALDTISEAQRRSLLAIAILTITGAGSKTNLNAAELANNLYTLKYSRKREREADMVGIDLVHAAGGNPGGLVTAMQKLLHLENESGAKPIKILSTHPATQERIDYMKQRCLALGVPPEKMELQFKDQPNRLGDVVSKHKSKLTITVSSTRALEEKETLLIMKPLWDEATQLVIPKPIAKGVVTKAGDNAKVSVTMLSGFAFSDIEVGNGIYPPDPENAAKPDKNTKTD